MCVLIVHCGESESVSSAVKAWADQGIGTFAWDVKTGHRANSLELHADYPEQCALVHHGKRLQFSEVKAVWLASSNFFAIERPMADKQHGSFYFGEWFFSIETAFLLLEALGVQWINRPVCLLTHARDLRTIVMSAGLNAVLTVSQLHLPREEQWLDFSECGSPRRNAHSSPSAAFQTIDYVGNAYWVRTSLEGGQAQRLALSVQELHDLIRGHEQPVGRFEVATFDNGVRELIGATSFGELLFDRRNGLCSQGHETLARGLQKR